MPSRTSAVKHLSPYAVKSLSKRYQIPVQQQLTSSLFNWKDSSSYIPKFAIYACRTGWSNHLPASSFIASDILYRMFLRGYLPEEPEAIHRTLQSRLSYFDVQDGVVLNCGRCELETEMRGRMKARHYLQSLNNACAGPDPKSSIWSYIRRRT